MGGELTVIDHIEVHRFGMFHLCGEMQVAETYGKDPIRYVMAQSFYWLTLERSKLTLYTFFFLDYLRKLSNIRPTKQEVCSSRYLNFNHSSPPPVLILYQFFMRKQAKKTPTLTQSYQPFFLIFNIPKIIYVKISLIVNEKYNKVGQMVIAKQKQLYTMNQELFLRDDIIQFNSRMDEQGYNVKAYRKRTSIPKHRKDKKFLLSTEYLHSDINELRHDKSIDRSVRNTEALSTKRLASTAAVRKRSQLNDSIHQGFIKTARTKHNSCIEEPEDFEERNDRFVKNIKVSELKEVKGKFSKMEKEYSKGGQLKNKHFENWLNQILLEYCQGEKFDATIENPALKKYGIDKNSLLSKGINPENLERIFKSLFVYSMGFNTFLKQISGKNMNIRKTLWKVYAILLEYCSDGDFETMIGEIERDKIQKMEVMKEEIEKRQEIIENNEEINQEKNAKIFKELKLLREENVHLENDKNVLMEDYKEAEQAFNEEVSLRLRFENKINEIHGVHRQLTIKHQRLYDDLMAKNNENMVLKDKLAHLTDQGLILKNDHDNLRKENEILKEESKFNEGMVEQIKKKFLNYELMEIEWKHKKQDLTIVIRDREKKNEQLRNELKNAELMIKLREQSEKQLQKEYKRSLQQNKHLISSLQQQLEQINKQMLDMKQYQDANSKTHAEIDFLKGKLTDKQVEIMNNKVKIRQNQQMLNEKILQFELVEGKNIQLNIDIKDCYLKIEQMKKIKTQFEEEVMECKNKEQIYKNYYIQKDLLINSLTQKVDNLERIVSEFNMVRKTLQSKVSLLTQKIHADEETNKRKIDKLKEDVKSLDKQNKELKEQSEMCRADKDKYQALYEESFTNLKNQIFERNDLELRYKQSLTVVESETDHIKTLSIKISQLQERTQEYMRKIRGLEFIMEGKDKTFNIELHQLNHNIHQLKEQLKVKKHFIHPMKYEDLLSDWQRTRESINNFEEKIEEERRKYREHAPQFDQKLEHAQRELIDVRFHLEQQLGNRQMELEHEREKNKNLRDMLEDLEVKLAGSQPTVAPENYNYKEKERKYLQVIKEKSSRIDELYKEVEAMHDQNNTLIKRVSEAENIIKEKSQRIANIQQEKSLILSQKNSIINEKITLMKEQQKLIAKVVESQSKILQSPEERSKTLLNIPPSRENRSAQKSHRDTSSRQEQTREKATQPGWRSDFSKKMKNAYTYYNK